LLKLCDAGHSQCLSPSFSLPTKITDYLNMGNINCVPLTSTDLFSVIPIKNVNGQSLLDLVDPLGYGDCPTALAAVEQLGCVDSTTSLVCLLELEPPPKKIELCPGTQIWVDAFAIAENNYLDTKGVDEIKCQDDTCTFLRTGSTAPDPCPWFVTELGEDSLAVKDISFFELSFNFLLAFGERSVDPTDIAEIREVALMDVSSFVFCQEAVVSNEGVVDKVKTTKGDLDFVNDGNRGKKGGAMMNGRGDGGRERHLSIVAFPKGLLKSMVHAVEMDGSRRLVASKNRDLQKEQDLVLDAKIKSAWECVAADMVRGESVDASSISLTLDDLLRKTDCILAETGSLS
jgi:hypothetical protein